MPHSTVKETLARLRDRYPSTSFIALGQTVFWDEPVKAVWRTLLDSLWPEAEMIAGVHDTDYFAKSTSLIDTDATYAMLPHNDGATRGLWSAAGELSTLFGSEDVPTRAMFEHYGVPFARLAASSPEGRDAFYDQVTEAWGWRGIVHTGSEPPIAHDVQLSEFLPALISQLQWGFETSVECIAPEMRGEAEKFRASVLGWVTDFADNCPLEATLADLYKHVLPRFYETLLGSPANNFTIDSSMSLFRFDPSTAALPRFAVLDLFLNEATRQKCVDAYNHAVAGGGMYTLDSFGEGALPFDVVVPGRGRGTLTIDRDGVGIAWRHRVERLTCPGPVADRAMLAKMLHCELGDRVALVGKAVALIDMLAAEFIVVFHETASGYTPRTAAMNDAIRAAGNPLDLKPIVRLSYPTWDSLATSKVRTPLKLPDHLALAFDRHGAPIAAEEFGERWREVVAAQEKVLETLRLTRTPRGLFDLFSIGDAPGPNWRALRVEYDEHIDSLIANSSRCDDLKPRMSRLREQIEDDKQARLHTEQAKGNDFRATLGPLLARQASGEDVAEKVAQETSRRAKVYDAAINGCRNRIREARREIRRLRAECRRIERCKEAVEHRRRLAQIAVETETERLVRIRSAFITAHSLPHTNARPSAWWLPLVDPSGAWFAAMVDGAQARLEEV